MAEEIFTAEDIQGATAPRELSFLTPGLHPNLTLKTPITKKAASSGNEYYLLEYQNEKGASFNQFVFMPDGNAPANVGKGETKEETNRRLKLLKMGEMKQVLDATCDPNAYASWAKSCKDYIESAVDLINKNATNKVNLKLVYDKSGKWAAIPSYKTKWIESGSVKVQELSYSDWEMENAMKPKASDAPKGNESLISDTDLNGAV